MGKNLHRKVEDRVSNQALQQRLATRRTGFKMEAHRRVSLYQREGEQDRLEYHQWYPVDVEPPRQTQRRTEIER